VTARVKTPLWLGIALLLIALNLRVGITSVPPVLEDVRADFGISTSTTGLLTALPVLCFGLFGFVAPALARRWGPETVLLGCLAAIAGGILVRLAPEVTALFAGTLLIGAGIAVCNILVPVVVKRDYERPGSMMGIYTMAMNGGAGLGAGLTVPADHALHGSWRIALALWVVPVLAAIALWIPAVRLARREADAAVAADAPAGPRPSLARDPVAWALAAFFGIQSTLFYSCVAWVPDVVRDAGMSEATAGVMLALIMIFGLPTAMAMPVLATRFSDQRPLVLATGALWIGGLAGLLLSPGTATPLWMVMLGMAQGAGIALALTLIVLRAPDGRTAAALSGMVQSVGYLVVPIGPVVLGLLHDATHGWHATVATMLAVAGVFVVAGLAAVTGMLRTRLATV
jgi:CP family cyanate transporter-like MFS transporter